MKIKVLFENDKLMVLDKPAGWVVHGDGKETKGVPKDERNISDYILKNFKKIKGVGENQGGTERPGIVHRLDKDTTGCLVVAKTQDSFENLKNQFQNHKIRKEYLALVWGEMKHETGIIDASIARSKNDFRKKEVVKVTSGANEKFRGEERQAMTRYKVLKRLSLFGEKLTLVNFFPETGRTHQIRIHSKSIGHSIVGDHLYGGNSVKQKKFEDKFFKNTKLKNNTRQLLHAKSISFHNPETGELVKVESPIPKDFDPIM